MVGDGDSTDDIRLPLVFLFSREGAILTAALEEHRNVDVLLLPKERQLERGEAQSSAGGAQLHPLLRVSSMFLLFSFPDDVEKSVGMNIKLRLAEEEEMEGPTLELVFTEGEMLLKEKGLRGDEQQRLCTETSGKD